MPDDEFIDDPGFGDSSLGGGFDAIFAIFPIIFGLVVVGGIVLAVMNFKKAHDAGVNPFTMETEAMTRFIKSDMMKAEKPVVDRLAELTALREQGIVSQAEHDQIRAQILKDV